MDEILGVQPTPPPGLVWLAAAVALALVVVPALWRTSRHVVTIAHEGAHGVAALATGRRLAGIRLHADGSGVTVSSGSPCGAGMVVTAAAGYVGPALLGLAAAALLHEGHALAVLWLTVVLLALLLVQIRNFHGLYAVLVAGALVFAVTWWGSGALQSFVAYAGTWFLLLSAPRAVLDLQHVRRRGRSRDSDADQLARLTHVPALVWVGLFLLADGGALLLGASLVLSR